ncbi:pyrroline-5-carboxylate reductase [Kocuria coralli]|nr:pyrroline-5-carboxylate reductase [Kocuria coralli]
MDTNGRIRTGVDTKGGHMDDKTMVAFLGTGTMGGALLKGSLDGGLDAGSVRVTARRQSRVDELVAAHGVRGTTDNAEAATHASVVVLAVGPASIPDVLGEIAGHLTDGAVVVSIADGISLEDLRGGLPGTVSVARAMPSLAAEVGSGLTLLTFERGCADEQRNAVTALFERSGEVLEVDEEQQADLSVLSSGGPAYFFYVAAAMIEAAAIRGVNRDLGRRLVAQAMAGSAAWLQRESEAPDELRARVCAPGGAGISRIAELDERAVRAAFIDALTKDV